MMFLFFFGIQQTTVVLGVKGPWGKIPFSIAIKTKWELRLVPSDSNNHWKVPCLMAEQVHEMKKKLSLPRHHQLIKLYRLGYCLQSIQAHKRAYIFWLHGNLTGTLTVTCLLLLYLKVLAWVGILDDNYSTKIGSSLDRCNVPLELCLQWPMTETHTQASQYLYFFKFFNHLQARNTVTFID